MILVLSRAGKSRETGATTKMSDQEMHTFWKWFQLLSSEQRRAFLDGLVSVAVPHKLFAQVDRTAISSRRLPDTWAECRRFEEQMLYCCTSIARWDAAQANRFLNSLEEVDQPALYEFYDKIANTVGEP